jgi:hypothetical protein
MTKEVRYNLIEITDGMANRNTPREQKMEILGECINLDRWSFLGFDNNGATVRLKPKFHNKRDRKGRFTAIRSR